MRQLDLQSLLAAVDVPVDWVGIREVTETHSPRVVRDGVPQVNGCFTTQGLMVEVLTDGQFGYYGTPNMTDIGISDAAKKAYGQAKRIGAIIILQNIGMFVILFFKPIWNNRV